MYILNQYNKETSVTSVRSDGICLADTKQIVSAMNLGNAVKRVCYKKEYSFWRPLLLVNLLYRKAISATTQK